MLLPRVLSAIVMAVVFVFAVVTLDDVGFMFFTGAILVVAAWEWARLSGVKVQQTRIAFAGMVATLSYGVAIFDLQRTVLWITPVLWCFALYWVISYPDIKAWKGRFLRLSFGLSILLTTWCALAVIKQGSQFITYLILLMALIWGADTGAYFAGRLFGKRKLARHVSPGKSWEGVIGGVVLTQVGIFAFASYQGFALNSTLILSAVGLVTVAVSVLGDLTESLFKRHESLKDSSRLIPGHGGVMDRIDSVTSAAPVFVLLMMNVGWL